MIIKLTTLKLAIILSVLILGGCMPASTGPKDIPPVSTTQLPMPDPTQDVLTTSEPTVTISPTSGPSGALVQVTASGFPANMPVWVALGPVNSEFNQVAQGVTDANGIFTVQVPVAGEPGMNLVFAVVPEGQPGVMAPEQFQVVAVTGTNPTVNIAPTSGPSGTLVYVTATGFPANESFSVFLGPANSEFSQVAQGVSDANGVILAQVPANGAPGMTLAFAVAVADQPGVLSPDQFQIIFAVPNPQLTPPLNATPTPYLDMWTTFSSPAFAISLQYPADWQPAGYGSPETGEIKFAGINGFFHINSMDADSIDILANAEAGHRLQPYGSQPTIEALQIQGQEARLILPSSDQPAGMQYQAALIVRYPEVESIVWSPRYFVLWADMPHIRTIAETLRFTN
ncbi:MAG: hypothetical protein MUO58_08320 [Anaerolineales bacterium]|nr:hypothetical protein [Anaerolineales bacterium]